MRRTLTSWLCSVSNFTTNGGVQRSSNAVRISSSTSLALGKPLGLSLRGLAPTKTEPPAVLAKAIMSPIIAVSLPPRWLAVSWKLWRIVVPSSSAAARASKGLSSARAGRVRSKLGLRSRALMFSKVGASKCSSVARSPIPNRLGFFGSVVSRWASLPWIQCIRRGYSVLLPLKKRAVE